MPVSHLFQNQIRTQHKMRIADKSLNEHRSKVLNEIQTEFGMLKGSYTKIKLINVTEIYKYNMAYKQIFLM
jgi:hypothetical protein